MSSSWAPAFHSPFMLMPALACGRWDNHSLSWSACGLIVKKFVRRAKKEMKKKRNLPTARDTDASRARCLVVMCACHHCHRSHVCSLIFKKIISRAQKKKRKRLTWGSRWRHISSPHCCCCCCCWWSQPLVVGRREREEWGGRREG